MPWCGYWGTAGAAYWWILPLIGLVFMAVMFLVCFRGFGRMCGRRRDSGDLSALQREVEGLKEEVRKQLRNPS